jgi:hypothetical protein
MKGMMRRARLGLVVALGFPSVVCVIVAACTTAGNGGNDDLIRFGDAVADTTIELKCHPPVYRDRVSSITVPIETFAGDYALTAVAYAPLGSDTIAHGMLWLRPTDTKYRKAPNPDITHPLFGASNIDLRSLGPVSLAYSPASRSRVRPGVQATYSSSKRTLKLIFGAASGPGFYVDAGVLFNIYRIDSTGFSGGWVDGGHGSPLPGGYFCALRVTRHE